MIRPCRESDTEELVRIWLEASLQAHPFIPAEYWKAHVPSMRELYLPASDVILVYEEEGAVGGFMAMVDDYVAALFIAPKFQRRGVGTRFLDIAKRMKRTLCLNVYARNRGAIRFYERCGFRIAGERVEKESGEIEYEMEFGRSASS